MAKSWKQKYETRWKTFSKNVQKLQSEGRLLPEEVLDIQQAKGGYKGAYEKLQRYDLASLKRLARAEEIQQLALESEVVESNIMELKNIIATFDNYPLRKEFEKKLSEALGSNTYADRKRVSNAIQSNPEILETLQKASEIPYIPKDNSVDYQETAFKADSLLYYFSDLLDVDYTDDERFDDEEDFM